MSVIRVLVARILASVIATAAVWVAAHWGFAIGPDDQVKLTEAGVILLMGVFTVIYGVLHKIIDRHVNPGDAASAKLATVEAAETKILREGNTPPGSF